MLSLRYVRGCLLLMVAALCTSASQEKPQPPRVTSGEVVVKFSPETRAGELTARAATSNSVSDPEVSSYIDALSKDLGVPLEIKRFGSGGNVIVAIRESELANLLVKKLEKEPCIKHARVVHGVDSSGTPAVEADLIPCGSKKSTSSHEHGSDGRDSRAITDRLEEELGSTVRISELAKNRILLTPSMTELTEDVAARLNQREDVAYAQPNFIRRPLMPPSSPASTIHPQ